MSPRVRLQVIETPPDRAVTRLHQLVRQREVLRASFHDVWERVAAGQSDADLDAWAEGALELAFVNAGPACLLAFWRTSVELGAALGLTALSALARDFANVCRHAGAEAALAGLNAIAPAFRGLGTRHELGLWATGMQRLARAAPESVVAVAMRTETILQSCDGAAFESFIAAGLKASGTDRARRRAFFTLEDPLARQVLERAGGTLAFSQVERPLKLFATALWGRVPVLRGAGPAAGRPAPRRISMSGGIVRVPQIFRGVSAHTASLIFRAGIAHATAHLALSPGGFPVGSLKPQQIVLVGLIEDARVEALAMRRFPGLRKLWAPFHVAEPAGVVTAPALLARMARALFDAHYRDNDGFVVRARDLFAAATDQLEDPAISRRIGGLLGNDLGQMRAQLDARSHVIEPVYRDDNLGLWDFGPQSEPAADAADIMVEAARIVEPDELRTADRQRQDPNQQDPDQNDARPDEAKPGRAREAEPDQRGIPIASYPEWDRAAGIERPDWATVRDVPPVNGDPGTLEQALEGIPALRAQVHRLVRATRIGRHQRRKRQPDGPELDFDAALDAAIALRAGETPDPRVHRTMARQDRDLAVLILLDVSESTRHGSGDNGSVLDLERVAVAALCEALCRLGDPFALSAFASAGRDDVRITRIKDFAKPYDAAARARLAGLTPGLSTRLGVALRHAGAEIAGVRSHRKLILVLTDGEPSDVDVADPLDLVEDARRATVALRAGGIDVFGVTLDPAGTGSGAAVFGRNNMPVRRLADLPSRLADLYFRLSRR
jgi:nitric oxide reductase NorD protein